ncbi:hypothetical protein L6R52_41495 [Myxococcota bacterium]|nr:hypothetical protein [Myxococcota bacterium]
MRPLEELAGIARQVVALAREEETSRAQTIAELGGELERRLVALSHPFTENVVDGFFAGLGAADDDGEGPTAANTIAKTVLGALEGCGPELEALARAAEKSERPDIASAIRSFGSTIAR